jgi:hypothetical protein
MVFGAFLKQRRAPLNLATRTPESCLFFRKPYFAFANLKKNIFGPDVVIRRHTESPD